MIALIGTMLRERRFQAVMLTLLASIAFAAAVGLPAYLAAVDRSAIATEIAHATRDQRLIETRNDVQLTPQQQSAFGPTVSAAMAASSLSVGYAVQTNVAMLDRLGIIPILLYRQDACAHVVIESGRCPIGSGEVMIAPSLARSSSLHVGGSTEIAYVNTAVQPQTLDAPMVVEVVGIYRPRDPGEAFWGDTVDFQASPPRETDAPILTSAGTFAALPMDNYSEYVDAVLDPSAITPDRLGEVAAQVRHAADVGYGANTKPSTDIPTLLANIRADRAGAHEYLPIMGFPVIGIGWLVIFLASAYALSGRREELGVVALRGVHAGPRWWSGVGEALISILIAIPCGYLLAFIGVRLATPLLIPNHVSAPPIGPGSTAYVAVTFVGFVLAILAAAWRPLRTSAADLLRGVPPRSPRWRTAAIELLVVLIAGVLLAEWRSQRGRLVTLDQIAPVFAIGAIAIVASRLVLPLATLIGRRGVRRGRRSLGLGIGALQIARRPGVSRLFVLMTIAIGMVTYAAAGASVAEAARASRASIAAGADTIVSVGAVTRLGLLAAVRKADPSGRYALAATQIPRATLADPPLLAIDASRLAAVALWPAGPISAERASALLHPNVGKPLIVTGALLSATITARDAAGGVSPPPEVSIYTEPINGGAPLQAYFTAVKPGSTTYTSPIICVKGCRITGMDVSDPDQSGNAVTVTIHPARVTVPAGSDVTGFTAAANWEPVPDTLTSEKPGVSDSAGNLVITVRPGNDGTSARLLSASSTTPVPVLSTRAYPGPAVGAIGNPDRLPVPIRVAATVPDLPGLPDGGILMDLDDVDSAVPVAEDDAFQPQVWLSAAAPSTMIDRLQAAGLTITGEVHRSAVVGYFARQGTAIAAGFALPALIGVLLMTVGAAILTSSVDRLRRGTELFSLRIQGLPERSVRGAARFAYLGLGVAAALAGLVAGLVSWRLTGARVPVFTDDHPLIGVSIWPGAADLFWPWVIASAVVLVVSGAAAGNLRRFVRHGAPIKSRRVK